MNTVYKDELVNALSRYGKVSGTELEKFLALSEPVILKRGEYFIKAGENPPWLGFVLSGVFRRFQLDGRAEFNKYFLKEGDFIAPNSQSLLDKGFILKSSEYYFQAIENAVVLKIEDFAGLGKLSHAYWQQLLIKQIEREKTIEERRVRQLLLDDARGLYISFLRDFPDLEERIRQIHIASYLGISPVSLSRLKAALL